MTYLEARLLAKSFRQYERNPMPGSPLSMTRHQNYELFQGLAFVLEHYADAVLAGGLEPEGRRETFVQPVMGDTGLPNID